MKFSVLMFRVIGIAFILSVCCVSLAQLANSAWPKFQGGLGNTGLGPLSAAVPITKWSATQVQEPEGIAIGPDGTIYVSDLKTNGIYALSPATGGTKWFAQPAASAVYESSPVVSSNGDVIVEASNKIWALNGATGAIVWGRNLATGTNPNCSPTIGPDGTIYAVSGSNLYAFNPSTGSILWTFIDTGNTLETSPAMGSNGLIYLVDSSAKVLAINGATGLETWFYGLPGQFNNASSNFTPAVGPDNTVYVPGLALFALDGNTGAQKWMQPINYGYPTCYSPAIGADDTVFVGGANGGLFAFDGQTGAPKWVTSSLANLNLLNPTNDFYSPFVIDRGGNLYFNLGGYGLGTQDLICVNGASGYGLWGVGTGNASAVLPTPPCLAIGSDGTLYFPDDGYGLVALQTFQSSNLSLAKNAISPGGFTYATVNLPGQNSTPLTMSLASSSPSLTVPSSVSISAFAGSAEFRVNAKAGTSNYASTISASFGGVAQTANLLVGNFALLLNSSSVVGGNPLTGSVLISSPAPSGGVTVSLSSDHPSMMSVPATVTIPSGATSANFTASTTSSTNFYTAWITASEGGNSSSQSIQVMPLVAQSITFSPSTIEGGGTTLGTVSLNGPVPSGTAIIALASGIPSYVGFPSSVQIAAGSSSATFSVTSKAFSQTYYCPCSASYGNITVNSQLVVAKESIANFSFTPSFVLIGNPTVGLINLTAPAPTGGWKVNLGVPVVIGSSSALPSSVTVPAGQTALSFNLSWPYAGNVPVTASDLASTAQATFHVFAPIPQSLTFSPSSVIGGNSVVGTITLNGVVSSATVVSLASSIPNYVGVPESVTVQAGSSSASFNVTTQPYPQTYACPCSASLDGVTANQSLTVLNDSISSLTLTPNPVTGGNTSTGRVTLNDPAPAGGWTVNLSSSLPSYVGVPATLTVPAGLATATFTVTTLPYPQAGYSSLIAAYDGASRSQALLQVNP